MLNNRKNSGRAVVILCVAAMTAFASIAQAHEGEGGCGGGLGGGPGDGGANHPPPFMFKKLGLTDAQKAQAKAIFKTDRTDVKSIFASLNRERKNLQALIHADTIDEAAIRAETLKIASIEADLHVNRAKMGVQFRAILTPEKLVTLKSLEQNHRPKHNSPPEQGE